MTYSGSNIPPIPSLCRYAISLEDLKRVKIKKGEDLQTKSQEYVEIAEKILSAFPIHTGEKLGIDLEQAIAKRNFTRIQELLASIENIPSLYLGRSLQKVVEMNDRDILRELLTYHSFIPNADYSRALALAVRNNSIDIVADLLQHRYAKLSKEQIGAALNLASAKNYSALICLLSSVLESA